MEQKSRVKGEDPDGLRRGRSPPQAPRNPVDRGLTADPQLLNLGAALLGRDDHFEG